MKLFTSQGLLDCEMNLNILFFWILRSGKQWLFVGKQERFARPCWALNEFKIKRKVVLNACFDEIESKISCIAKILYLLVPLGFIPVVSLVGSLKIHWMTHLASGSCQSATGGSHKQTFDQGQCTDSLVQESLKQKLSACQGKQTDPVCLDWQVLPPCTGHTQIYTL